MSRKPTHIWVQPDGVQVPIYPLPVSAGVLGGCRVPADVESSELTFPTREDDLHTSPPTNCSDDRCSCPPPPQREPFSAPLAPAHVDHARPLGEPAAQRIDPHRMLAIRLSRDADVPVETAIAWLVFAPVRPGSAAALEIASQQLGAF
jgi:hypothetical protein